MELLNMIWLWIFGLTPIVLSIIFGFYWLKHERFPWEKNKSNDASPNNKDH